MLIKKFMFLNLMFLSYILFASGNTDNIENNIIIPSSFCDNKLEINANGNIDKNILNNFTYIPSIKMYSSDLDINKNLFNRIYLELNGKKIKKIELELDNKNEYPQYNDRVEKILFICNQFYGKGKINKNEININYNTSIEVFIHNMTTIELNINNIKIVFCYMEMDRLIELKKMSLGNVDLWYKLYYYF